MTTTDRPACDLRGIAAPSAVVARVAETLRQSDAPTSAATFLARAEAAMGMNALWQIVQEYVQPTVWR